jgi:hypothetical protein
MTAGPIICRYAGGSKVVSSKLAMADIESSSMFHIQSQSPVTHMTAPTLFSRLKPGFQLRQSMLNVLSQTTKKTFKAAIIFEHTIFKPLHHSNCL